MNLAILLAVAVNGAPPSLNCHSKDSVVTGMGYTASGHYFNLTKQPDAGSCCSLCDAIAECQVWSWHPTSQCSLGDKACVSPHAGEGTVSGSKTPVDPNDPAANCSSPTPKPKPKPKPPTPPPTFPAPVKPLGPVRPGSPNIVFFLTDDQDTILGGWDPMHQANALLSERGATGKYWVTHTPVCCPSRTELLSSRYFHNIKVESLYGQESCMHCKKFPEWADDLFFAPSLRAAGYRVGVFGKFLNGGNPTDCPPGVETWLGNSGGNYLNPTFAYEASAGQGGKMVTFNDTSAAGAAYSTSVIGNISVPWVKAALQDPHPFMAYIAPKAPHIQDGPGFPITIPAPWYDDAFDGVKAPRTPSWNYSARDHHWLIAQQPAMTSDQAMHSDALYRARWQSLLTVDDLVAAVVKEVEDAGALSKTFFIYTSDHGYRFGQFRMPQGKWNVYDNNIRIPFTITGPGIAANSSFDFIGSNVDVMPTVLGLAGLETPATMDGRSIVPELIAPTATVPAQTTKHVAYWAARQAGGGRAPWRSDQLIEYYGLGNVVRYEHLEDTYNNTFRALRVMEVDPATKKKKGTPYANALYVEFTDIRTDFNFTGTPQFYELYDLDQDPWMMTNAYNATAPELKVDLHTRLMAAFLCRGSPDAATHASDTLCN